ncbi:MAG: hypothetical protein LBE83_03210 [Propionibacteriaceae bacterium]|jgi:hypothetical protein|nr:hypothetical protein [Propionibacteriaceae bacterium]
MKSMGLKIAAGIAAIGLLATPLVAVAATMPERGDVVAQVRGALPQAFGICGGNGVCDGTGPNHRADCPNGTGDGTGPNHRTDCNGGPCDGTGLGNGAGNGPNHENRPRTGDCDGSGNPTGTGPHGHGHN